MNPKYKFLYLKLNKSKLNLSLKKIINSKNKKLYFEEDILNNKDYLLTLSKFIDYKINNNKLKYRSKNNCIIIENIAQIISKLIYKNTPYNLFFYYKKSINMYSVKVKEDKIFKILLAQKLITELTIIDSELNQISKIIQIYKKRKFVINYRKDILNIAKCYSILKWNPNSTKLSIKYNINKSNTLTTLLTELFDAKYRIKVIIEYLKAMF